MSIEADWIGNIPPGWSAVRFRHLLSLCKGRNVETSASEESGYLPSITAEFLRSGVVDRFAASHEGGVEAQDGDLLLLWDGSNAGEFFRARRGLVGSTLAKCDLLGQGLDQRFSFFAAKALEPHLQGLTVGMGIPHVDGDTLKNFYLPVPSLDEQRAIATRLDREVARVDTLIEKKRRQIELLQEKRAAGISRAVTKGLDPRATLKDSGIVWLGAVPAHWPIVRLGYFAQIKNGSTPSQANPEYWIEGSVPWLSSGKVNDDVITEPSAFITEQARRDCGLQIIPKGSVVIGLVGQGRTRGLAAMMGMEATINQNMAAVIPGPRLVGRFVQYLFQHMYGPIREIGRGANQAALNCELVSDIRIPLPSIDEQQALVSHLDIEGQRCLAIQAHIQRSLGLLQEYRSTLISVTVTGKIRVGDLVPKLRRPAGASDLTVGQDVAHAFKEPQ